MEKSETIKNLAEALSKFQSEMEAITKDATNPFFKSKYASLSAIIEDTRSPLGKNGLSYAQFPTGQNGLTTLLMHKSGEWLSATYEMTPVDQKPQSVGSALTYMRRYALCSVLGLQVDDDDGNEATGKKAAKGAGTVIRVPLDKGEEIGDIQVVGTDTDIPQRKITPPKGIAAKRDAQRRTIKDLIDNIVEVPLETAEEYQDYVKSNTGLALEEGNYPEIITRLEAFKR